MGFERMLGRVLAWLELTRRICEEHFSANHKTEHRDPLSSSF